MTVHKINVDFQSQKIPECNKEITRFTQMDFMMTKVTKKRAVSHENGAETVSEYDGSSKGLSPIRRLIALQKKKIAFYSTRQDNTSL